MSTEIMINFKTFLKMIQNLVYDELVCWYVWAAASVDSWTRI